MNIRLASEGWLDARFRRTVLSVAVAISAGTTVAAWAQQETNPDAVEPEATPEIVPSIPVSIAEDAAPLEEEEKQAGTSSVDEIVVTATKRSVSLQEVPASIASIGGDDLDRRGVDDVASLAAQVPNLAFGTNGIASFVTIRGVGTTVDSGVAEPSVATYVDGVFLPKATMGFLRQVDLERVEVLRGPQGTLYGRNATAGAMNFVSRAPSDEIEFGSSLSTGSRNAFGANAYLSGPLLDNLYARISGGRESQDGYVKVLPSGRRIADTDVKFVRGALRFEPLDDLSLDLWIKYEKKDDARAFQQPLTPVEIPPLAPQTTEPNRMVADGPFESPSETTIAGFTANWKLLDGVALRSTTGYVNHDSFVTFDGDGTGTEFLNLVHSAAPSESVSQEFNFFGDFDDLTWLVGLYYFKENYDLTLPAVVTTLGGTVRATIYAEVKQRTESYAAFTDFTYAITDAFKFNGGLRYNEEKKDFLYTSGQIVGDGPLIGSSNLPSGTRKNDVLPKAGLQYEFTDDLNVYGQWQKGVKSGGHQISSDEIFPGEKITSYELGAKSRWLDRRLTLNGAVFNYRYRDLQITNVIPPTTTLVENADAKITGLEAEVGYEPIDSVRLNLGVSVLDSKYTRFVSTDQANASAGDQDLSGTELVRAPDYTISAGAEWNIPIGFAFVRDTNLRAEIFHSDDVVMRYFATPNDTQSAYTISNLSALFNDSSGHVQVKVFVNNLTDKVYLLQDTYIATFGSYMGIYSEPRTWGAQITMRF